MSKDAEKIQVRVDGYTRVCLTVIAILLTVMVIGLWAEPDSPAGPAWAQGAPGKAFLDSSAQRKAMIAQQKLTTQKLQELVSLLKNGQAKVQIVGGKAPAKKAPSPIIKKP